MMRASRRLPIACLLALVATGCGGTDAPPGNGVVDVPFALAFFQESFDADGQTLTHTAWGGLQLDYSGPAGALYFFNFVYDNGTDAEWQIRNVPVSPRPPGGAQSVHLPFHLSAAVAGLPVALPGLRYAASLTTGELDGAPQAFLTASLAPRLNVFASGEVNALLPAIAPAPNMLPLQIQRDPGRSFEWAFQPKSFPNQDCGLRECVPAAISNSLVFLNAQHALGLTADQMSIDDTKILVDWRLGGAPGHLFLVPWWDTKTLLAGMPPYNLITDVMMQDGTEFGRIADFCQAIEDIQKKRDVELRVDGHVAALTGIIKSTAGGRTTFALFVSHDTAQGVPGGTRNEVVLYDPVTNTFTGGTWIHGKMHDRLVVEFP